MSMFRKLRPGGSDSSRGRRITQQAEPGSDEKSISSSTTVQFVLETEVENISLDPSRPSGKDDYASIASLGPQEESSFYHLSPPRQSNHQNGARDPLGLSLIHGVPDPIADIIFVHGLGGSSLRTWSWQRDVDLFWPEWIHHEEGLTDYRVFSYGYDANFWNTESPFSIMDFSKSLLFSMAAYSHGRAEGIGLRPIIFVGHSMGGLVVKKALIIGKNDDRFSKMISKVHGIMFFSTPHRGSSHARTLNGFLSIAIGLSTKVYVSELSSSSTSIEDIEEQFRTICSQLHLVSLYETQATKLMLGVKTMVVTKESGVLNYPNEKSRGIDADHHTICKFPSRLDRNYLHAIKLLKQLTRQLECGASGDFNRSNMEEAHTLRIILQIQGDIRHDLETNLAQALPVSCEWLHQRESFRRWRDVSDTRHRVLWLTGMMGAGKSTLAAKTIDHIQKGMPCMFHFFVASQPETTSVTFCLRVIAFQLATAYPEFAQRLVRLNEDTKLFATTQKFQIIWETIFENIAFKMDFGSPQCWVLDGLDEADTPHELVVSLLKMQSRTPIKLLFLSRPDIELTSLTRLNPDSATVDPISPHDTLGDIQKYIKDKAPTVVRGDQTLADLIVDKVAKRAEGSFLWTRLALDSLKSWHSLEDFEKGLDNIPNELQDIYGRMLNDVNSQQPQPRAIAFRILSWAVYSFRPITIWELSDAIKPEFGDLVNLRETALQTCGQFIRIDQDMISLAHDTVRKYLLHTSAEIIAARDYPAIVCLKYLSRRTWRQSLAQTSKVRPLASDPDRPGPSEAEFPFLKYAITFWAYHVGNSSSETSAIVDKLRHFCDKYISLWIQAVAALGDLRIISNAAMYFEQHRNIVHCKYSSPSSPRAHFNPETKFVEQWAKDLIRMLAKFGANLAQCPLAIHRHIPPFCPTTSAIQGSYTSGTDPLITVTGISNDDWDDTLARLRVGDEDEIASKIRCASVYVLTLICSSGTVIIWHTETFEELRRLLPNEWVRNMEINRAGNLVVTDGRSTLKVWDVSTGSLLHSLPRQRDERIMSLNFAIDSTALILGYDDCSVISHDLEFSKETPLMPSLGQDALSACPRFMVLSPDHTKLAVGFPGRPVVVWELGVHPPPEPRSVVRSGDRVRLENGEDVFNPPETIRWHPDGTILYILYYDTTIVAWDLIDDAQFEAQDTGARELAVHHRGSSILTSDNNGSISVWGLPKFNLIYRLQCDEFVRDLTFSPDGQRIYDVRGSNWNVWAPDILVRHNEELLERNWDDAESDVSEHVPEPVIAEDKYMRGRITALVCDDEDEFFCCGRDDGSVSIHEMKSGVRVRKVTNHSKVVDIVAIHWSPSRRFIASVDDSGKVIVKRLRIKDDDTWAVYPVFELRVSEEGLSQLLFSLDETFLLVSTGTMDRVWDLKKKAEVVKSKRVYAIGFKWMNHPNNESQLICVERSHLSIYSWADLSHILPGEHGSPFAQEVTDVLVEKESLTGQEELQCLNEKIGSLVLSATTNFLLYEVVADWRPQSHGKNIHMCQIEDLSPENCAGARHKALMGLGPEVRRVLGSAHGRLVFLDHDSWVCTSTIGWDMGSKRRLYFLPNDWANDPASNLMVVNGNATLLCPRYNEVAIVRYSGRL